MFFHAVFLFPCFLIAAAWASACDYPELPTDLELITAVEATDVREVHLHGMYSIGADAFDYAAKKFVHNLTLQYPAVQRFRVAIQPHDATDLDIRLVMTDDGKMVHCSMNGQQAVERMIFAMLQPNVKYTLQVRYTKSSNGVMCPRLMMELASQPDAQAVSFKESCDDSEAPVIPAIFPKSETEYYFEYKSAEDTFVTLGGTDDKERFSQVGRYPIRVPHMVVRQTWRLPTTGFGFFAGAQKLTSPRPVPRWRFTLHSFHSRRRRLSSRATWIPYPTRSTTRACTTTTLFR